MAFLGYPRGHRIDPETRCCLQQHTKRLMSAWILSLEPEHRPGCRPKPKQTALPATRPSTAVARLRPGSSARK